MIFYADSVGNISFIPPVRLKVGPVLSYSNGVVKFTLGKTVEQIRAMFQPEYQQLQLEMRND